MRFLSKKCRDGDLAIFMGELGPHLGNGALFPCLESIYDTWAKDNLDDEMRECFQRLTTYQKASKFLEEIPFY